MSEKKKDDKNRWRNKTIAFRGSPEEAAELDKRWKLCGYATKQDYLIDSMLHQQVVHQRKCDEIKEIKKFMLQNMFPQKG